MKKEAVERIVLIGMMGTFKTSAGKEAAARLKWNFIDTDEHFESFFGSISKFYEDFGEQKFRDAEAKIIQMISDSPRTVISAGGGVVLNEHSMELLSKKSIVIQLYATSDRIYQRILESDRPILKEADPRKKIVSLFAERKYLYDKYSQFKIDTSYQTSMETATAIAEIYTDY